MGSIYFGRGRVFAAEDDYVAVPKGYRANGTKPGVIVCHGAGQLALTTQLQAAFGQRDVVAAISARWPTLVADLGGDTWGNATVAARMPLAKAVLQAAPFNAKAGPVAVVGLSMGGCSATRYAVDHPADVACYAGLFPVCSIQDIRNNLGGASGIETAWGITYVDPLPAGAEVQGRAAALLANHLPIRLWYSLGDTIITPSTVTAFAAASGGTAIQASAVAGHVDNATLSAFADDLCVFLYSVIGA